MSLQYFRPAGRTVGDCMPFSHEGTFHLFYLLDEGHHRGKGGLGGHVWAHASTRDLVRWEHHPVAIPLSEDWEASICTGSAFFHAGTYHAFYPVRKLDGTEHLCHAVSADGVTFRKTAPNPFASAPPGYMPKHFRDPFVFADGGGPFHMLVTSCMENYPVHNRGGCLLHFVSPDLERWTLEGPFLIPGCDSEYEDVPECPDYFCWNGWYYVLFGLNIKTRYRMSRQPFGPWRRPAVDSFDGFMSAVMKTAPFGNNRRIGAAWLASREGDTDSGGRLWGGSAVFRELVQHADGTLGTGFVPEMIPAALPAIAPRFQALTDGATGGPDRVRIRAPEKLEVGALMGVPRNVRFRCTVRPGEGTICFGLGLRGSGKFERRYELRFSPPRQTVSLGNERIDCVAGLDRPFNLEAVLKDDILDICIDQRRCLSNRYGDEKGEALFFFCETGSVDFKAIAIRPLQST